jgi:hypothetical protein
MSQETEDVMYAGAENLHHYHIWLSVEHREMWDRGIIVSTCVKYSQYCIQVGPYLARFCVLQSVPDWPRGEVNWFGANTIT